MGQMALDSLALSGGQCREKLVFTNSVRLVSSYGQIFLHAGALSGSQLSYQEKCQPETEL